MRNRAINSLKYTGIVTLSQYIGSKKVKLSQVHNSGGNSLFDFLADCLVGDFTVAKATRPTKIMLIQGSAEKDEYGNTVFERPLGGGGFIYLLTKPEKIYDSTKSVVRYSFVIPKDIIVSIAAFDQLYIGLYTDSATLDEPNNYAAICKLDVSVTNLASAALVVDWELIISNHTAG